MKVHFSIHDVMPSTFSEVEETLALLEEKKVSPVTLLVVPGLDWSAEQLAQLKQWQQQDCELAGHGWQHKIERPRNLYAWAHGILFSRDVAEHLSLNQDQIATLIRHCYQWFGEHELNSPSLYVPPAWAMGSIKRQQLDHLPFRFYEYFNGWYDNQSKQKIKTPVLGFEADRWHRVPLIKFWNLLSRGVVKNAQRCRVAIHPYDLKSHMKKSLADTIDRWHEYACAEAAF